MLGCRTARRRRGVISVVAASVWIECARLTREPEIHMAVASKPPTVPRNCSAVEIEMSAVAKLASNGPTARHKTTKTVIVARRIKGFLEREYAPSTSCRGQEYSQLRTP